MRDEGFGRLDGLAGIVTGAGRGIGRACAVELAERGARVVVADADATALEEVVADLTGTGADAVASVTDVREWSSVLAMADECIRSFGDIDFVVANAGIGDYSSLDEGDPARWRRVVETNLLGVIHTVRAVYPRLKERGRGHIVLMASIAGRRTWVGEPVYIATKWGVVGLGWALRAEALEHDVRVTLVEPGMVDTPLVRSTPEGRGELERFAALSVQDVARTVAFALSQPEGVAISEIMVTPVGPEL
jgi:NADP-dependent 3-hydroxy acid dehydrogenase YdfG